jgi:predicted GH43/DUF377 family glycosyl hydrolase
MKNTQLTSSPASIPSFGDAEADGLQIQVTRRAEKILSDDRRVILRYLNFDHPPRIRTVVRRIMKLPDVQADWLVNRVLTRFAPGHRDLKAVLAENFGRVSEYVRFSTDVPESRRLLIGAYFTHEYSIEAAALFNPSIVIHPDQTNVPAGAVRFLMSLRATGEGHVSSIVFRRGTIHRDSAISFDPPASFAYTGHLEPPRHLRRAPYAHKLQDMDIRKDLVGALMAELPDPFTLEQLKAAVHHLHQQGLLSPRRKEADIRLLWPARASYNIRFPTDSHPAETTIAPATVYERQGMEDLRLVRFVDDGQVTFYGTYTANDGRRLHPMLLETSDFLNFHISPLTGRYARNKGMALFPRKVGGQYLMVSRHDGQSLFLLSSTDLHCWNEVRKLQTPTEPWELTLIGNCGSPIETEAGWILLTHGVGPMREYCIGASLLDRDDPARLIGKLKHPLLTPAAETAGGYVPNVVYSCGSMIHGRTLVIPYAVADSRVAFATVNVEELVSCMGC